MYVVDDLDTGLDLSVIILVLKGLHLHAINTSSASLLHTARKALTRASWECGASWG